MAVIERKSTAPAKSVYNSRGLSCLYMNAAGKDVIVDQEGDLWGLISLSAVGTYLMRSTDQGFSWTNYGNRFNGSTTRAVNVTPHGSLQSICIVPKWDKIFLYMSNYSNPNYYVDIRYIALSGALGTDASWTTLAGGGAGGIPDEVDGGLFAVTHNTNQMYFVYIDNISFDLKIRKVSPRTAALSAAV